MDRASQVEVRQARQDHLQATDKRRTVSPGPKTRGPETPGRPLIMNREALLKRLDDPHTLIPDWTREAIVSLIEELEMVKEDAACLVDEHGEQLREIESWAKDQGFHAGQIGGWY